MAYDVQMVMTWGWLINLGGDLGKLLSTCVQWDDPPSGSAAAVWNFSGQPVSALSGAALMRYVQSVPRHFGRGCLLVLEAGVKVTGGARFFDLVSKIGPFFGVHKQDIANKHMEKNHQRAWKIISCLDNFWNSSNTWYHMIFLMIPYDISHWYFHEISSIW